MELSTLLLFAAIVFIAAFVQSSAGFGAALVAMPLMISLLGIQVAPSLFAPIGLMISFSLFLYFRGEASIPDIWRLVVSSLIAIPIGLLLLKRIPAQISLTTLGIIIIWYVLNRHFQWHFPELKSSAWAFFFGTLGGLLSGAYNTSGPPIIVYANAKGWKPQRFKGNLQVYFSLNAIMTIISHAVSGNYSAEILPLIAISPVAIILGIVSGLKFSQKIDQTRFQQLVLLLLFILGIQLIWSGLT